MPGFYIYKNINLFHLFSISIQYAVIPHQWKIHKVIPVCKSGNRSSIKYYCPISLLSNISKVLECLIYNEIISKITDSISNAQFGFLKNRSKLQQLLILSPRSLPVVPKLQLMPSILTSTRPLILYSTANFQLNCGLQVFQEDFGPGSDHTYQTDPSILLLTINLQVYSLCRLVSCKAVSLEPCYY